MSLEWIEIAHLDEGKTQRIVRFQNDFGVSVVNGKNVPGGDIEGLWTFAVIRFFGKNLEQFKIHYKNPLLMYRNEVLKYVPENQLNALAYVVSRFEA